MLDPRIAFRIADQKQQRCAWLHQHLRMIPGRFQLVRARQQRRFQLLCVLDRISQRGGAQRMEVPACGIHDDQAMRRKQPRHQPCEGRAEGGPRIVARFGAIALSQKIADGRVAQEFACLFEQTIDIAIAGRHRRPARPCGKLHAQAQLLYRSFVSSVYLVHFLKVVIFRGQPEDRHMLHAGCNGRLLCPGDRSCRLQQRQQRTAQQPYLLACHYSSCTGAKLGDIREGGRPCPEAPLCASNASAKAVGMRARRRRPHPRMAQRLRTVPSAHRRCSHRPRPSPENRERAWSCAAERSMG